MEKDNIIKIGNQVFQSKTDLKKYIEALLKHQPVGEFFEGLNLELLQEIFYVTAGVGVRVVLDLNRRTFECVFPSGIIRKEAYGAALIQYHRREEKRVDWMKNWKRRPQKPTKPWSLEEGLLEESW